MKISTEIHKSSSGKWKWEFKIISYNNIDIISNKSYINFGSDNLVVTRYTDTYEEAELKIKDILDTIKHNIINYKNDRTKEKLWQWDDNNNEFKEIKGGC